MMPRFDCHRYSNVIQRNHHVIHVESDSGIIKITFVNCLNIQEILYTLSVSEVRLQQIKPAFMKLQGSQCLDSRAKELNVLFVHSILLASLIMKPFCHFVDCKQKEFRRIELFQDIWNSFSYEILKFCLVSLDLLQPYIRGYLRFQLFRNLHVIIVHVQAISETK